MLKAVLGHCVLPVKKILDVKIGTSTNENRIGHIETDIETDLLTQPLAGEDGPEMLLGWETLFPIAGTISKGSNAFGIWKKTCLYKTLGHQS